MLRYNIKMGKVKFMLVFMATVCTWGMDFGNEMFVSFLLEVFFASINV
jgi:hypothetical protein